MADLLLQSINECSTMDTLTDLINPEQVKMTIGKCGGRYLVSNDPTDSSRISLNKIFFKYQQIHQDHADHALVLHYIKILDKQGDDALIHCSWWCYLLTLIKQLFGNCCHNWHREFAKCVSFASPPILEEVLPGLEKLEKLPSTDEHPKEAPTDTIDEPQNTILPPDSPRRPIELLPSLLEEPAPQQTAQLTTPKEQSILDATSTALHSPDPVVSPKLDFAARPSPLPETEGKQSSEKPKKRRNPISLSLPTRFVIQPTLASPRRTPLHAPKKALEVQPKTPAPAKHETPISPKAELSEQDKVWALLKANAHPHVHAGILPSFEAHLPPEAPGHEKINSLGTVEIPRFLVDRTDVMRFYFSCASLPSLMLGIYEFDIFYQQLIFKDAANKDKFDQFVIFQLAEFIKREHVIIPTENGAAIQLQRLFGARGYREDTFPTYLPYPHYLIKACAKAILDVSDPEYSDLEISTDVRNVKSISFTGYPDIADKTRKTKYCYPAVLVLPLLVPFREDEESMIASFSDLTELDLTPLGLWRDSVLNSYVDYGLFNAEQYQRLYELKKKHPELTKGKINFKDAKNPGGCTITWKNMVHPHLEKSKKTS